MLYGFNGEGKGSCSYCEMDSFFDGLRRGTMRLKLWGREFAELVLVPRFGCGGTIDRCQQCFVSIHLKGLCRARKIPSTKDVHFRPVHTTKEKDPGLFLYSFVLHRLTQERRPIKRRL